MIDDVQPWSESQLREGLESFGVGDDPIVTTLHTDERVIARITDGIYRQPGSALRELISNAYDADATRVVIKTDRPRFGRITVDDDGLGMTPAVVSYVINHIGGSAKRNSHGIMLGVSDSSDSRLSPGGRKLIGKIGIGLFSVAQLTQSFQLVTKVRGDSFRTVARINLKQYSEDDLSSSAINDDYNAGSVRLWRVPAHDVDSHGTSIIIDAIRPQTRETLQSRGKWDAVDRLNGSGGQSSEEIQPPTYHIGAVLNDDESTYRTTSGFTRLPWDNSDRPSRAFEKLIRTVQSPNETDSTNPSVEKLFDYYLQMVWQLSLWSPLRYFDIHPFSLSGAEDFAFSILKSDGTAAGVKLSPHETIGMKLGVSESIGTAESFSIQVDELELARPVKVRDFPSTSAAFQTPIVIAGTYFDDFEGTSTDLTGGPIRFCGYLIWAPKITPVENRGVLLRVNGATGMPFNETFFDYPVSEDRRMSQITAEIFIEDGFDGALNIDRESFNFAHPHAVIVTRWLHEGVRRIIAEQKRLSGALLKKKKEDVNAANLDKLASIVSEVWAEREEEYGAQVPRVRFIRADGRAVESDSLNSMLDDDVVLPAHVLGPYDSRLVADQNRLKRTKPVVEALAQILSVIDGFDELSASRKAKVISAIRSLMELSGQK